MADEAEADEMRSLVESRANQRWLRNATDHKTGKIPAYTFGKRSDEVFPELGGLPEPFGIKKFHTDGLGAYMRNPPIRITKWVRRTLRKQKGDI